MPRVKSLLDSIALALYQKARKPLTGYARWVDTLPDVAKTTCELAHKELSTTDLTLAVEELIRLTPEAYSQRLKVALDHLEMVHPVPFRAELLDYFSPLANMIRAFFRRPSDPSGLSIPGKFRLATAEEFLLLLPPRRSLLGPGREPKGLDHWQLVELLGFGEITETWLAHDGVHLDKPAVLKFVIDPDAVEAMKQQQNLFLQAFRMVSETGVVPLRSVYLETEPAALETAYLQGYSLANLIWDWKWKHDSPRVGASLKLVKRIAGIVAKAHEKGIVHRDLKPTNILLHPTDGERFTLWVSEFGWSQIAASRSLTLAKGGTPQLEQHRLAARGSHSPIYSSQVQGRKETPSPVDDVYSIGVIWYQLLKRDPHAVPAVGGEWVEGLHAAGVPIEHLELLQSCLNARADKRPADAGVLSELLTEAASVPTSGSDSGKHFPLKPASSSYISLPLSSGPKSAVLAAQNVVPVKAQGASYGGMPRFVTNSIGMTFGLIPPGEFLMGSPDNEVGRRIDEAPLHRVRITQPFYFGAFLVTQSQYEKVMGSNPSLFTKANGGGPDHPVDSVNWFEAQKFCDRLGDLLDEEAKGRSYRLPTEAEWEYACRAGTTTPFSCGEFLSTKNAHFATGMAYGKSGGVARTAPVGSMPPNPFGLYDLHGNLQEWASDWYGEYYYHDSPAADPPGPAKGQEKILRGGCYTMFGSELRSASRMHAPPKFHNATIGLRVVMLVPAKK